MKRLIFLILILNASPLLAQARCKLDTTNPAITHGFIPIHGGSLQGVTGYNDPSEWVFYPDQSHWVCPSCNGMPFDRSFGLLNPASTHIHLHTCQPYYGEITGPIVIPFEILAFHFSGYFYFNAGPLVQDIVFDVPHENHFIANPMGLVSVTGHFTFNPFFNGGGPNIHSGAPNGWTNFMATAIAVLNNGDTNGATALNTIWTTLNPSAPLVPDFVPDMEAINGVSSFIDGGQRTWGSQVAEVTSSTLPLLAPFDTLWPINHIRAYMYGGLIGFEGQGQCSMRKDMDLHNGIVGVEIPGMPANCDGPGFLDPAVIGPGKHRIFIIWSVDSGAGGIPGIAAPNEIAVALLPFDVEVGPNVIVTTCQDPNANNFGGPLPCTYNLPDWQNITGQLQRRVDEIRILLPDGKIVILPSAVPQ